MRTRSLFATVSTTSLALLIAFGNTPTALGQDAAVRLIEARHAERISGDPERALPIYQAIAKGADPGSDLFGEAVIGSVRCYLALDRGDDADAFCRSLPAISADEKLAEQIRGLFLAYSPSSDRTQPGVERRIEGLITALRSTERSVEDALAGLGELADPFLIRAVRESTEPAVVSRAMRLLAGRMYPEEIGQTAIEFFASLDPDREPVLTMSALRQLQNVAWLPKRLNTMLDRCAASDLAGMRSLLLRPMGSRNDEEGRRYLIDALKVPAIPSKEVIDAAIRAPSGTATPVARAYFALGHSKDLIRTLRFDLDLNQRTDLWKLACIEGDSQTRRAALEMGVQSGDTPIKRLDEVARAELVEPFLDVVRGLGSSEADRTTASWLLSVYTGTPTAPWQAFRSFQTDSEVDELRQPGEGPWFGYLLDLPLTDEHRRELAKLHGRWVYNEINQGGNHPHPPVPLVEWLTLDLDREVDELIRMFQDGEFEHLEIVRNSLVTAMSRRAPSPARTRLLQELAKGVDFDNNVALQLLCRNLDPEARKACRAEMYIRGGNPLNLPGWAVPILFAPGIPETHEDVRAWLQDGQSGVRLVTVLRSIHRDSDLWTPEVLEATKAILVSSPFVGAREKAVDLLADAAPESLPTLAASLDLEPMSGQLAVNLAEALFLDAPESKFVQFVGKASPELVSAIFADVDPPLKLEDSIESHELTQLRIRVVSDPRYTLPTRHRFGHRLLATPGTVDEDAVAALLSTGGTSTQIVLARLNADQVQKHRLTIERCFEDADRFVRIEVLKALSLCGDARAAHKLIAGLRDPDSLVREQSLALLKSMRQHQEETEHWQRIENLKLGGATPLAALIKQANDDSREIQLAAVRGLGALGDPEALPHLIEMLRSEDEYLRTAAQESIDRLVTAGSK